MYTPEALTGAEVLAVRTRFKLSRVQFSELCGFTGKSPARLNNIEKNESWKPGDREACARALNALESGVTPSANGGIAASVVHPSAMSTTDPVFLLPFDDADDIEDLLLRVLPIEDIPQPQLDPQQFTHHTTDLIALDPAVYRFSNSEFQTFKRCRRKWWLAWYSNLVLQVENFTGVRSTGTRIHSALQAWYAPEGQPRVDPRLALERVVVEDWTKIHNLMLERGTSDEQQSSMATEFASSTNLERAMIEGYVQWLEETGADADLRIIASETPLVANLELPMGEGVEPRPIQLIGLLDSRTYRVSDGVRLFVDHKTVGDLASPVMTLPQNEQMLHYHLLEALSSEGFEDRCDGALYNMLRRVKRSARAKPPFYERVEVRHNKYELDSYKTRALAVSRQILQVVERLDNGESHFEVAYPSPTSSCRWDCDFFAVCNMFDDGSRGVNDMVNALYKTGDPRERYEKKGRSDA